MINIIFNVPTLKLRMILVIIIIITIIIITTIIIVIIIILPTNRPEIYLSTACTTKN